MEWSPKAKESFDKVITNLPQFHRFIAEKLVKESAEIAVGKNNRSVVEEKDVIEAFFAEIPPAFRDMLKRLLQHLHIDYAQYIKE